MGVWKDEETLFLKNNSTNKSILELSSFLNRTKSSVKHKLYKKSMYWKRKRKLRIDSKLLQMNGYPRSYSYGVYLINYITPLSF